MRRVHVSQVVEANAGLIAHLGEQADEFGSETDGLERLTVHLGDDVGLVRQPDPRPSKALQPGLSTTESCPRTRSIDAQRRAVIAPRRSPHMTAGRTGANMRVFRK